MKKYITIGALLVSGVFFAQSAPKLEAAGKLVKATYYYSNGKIQQEGYFKDGKLDGNWISYDIDGNKKSIGEYTNGEKSGKWLFWSENALSEVNYSNNQIASIKNWKQDAIVKN